MAKQMAGQTKVINTVQAILESVKKNPEVENAHAYFWSILVSPVTFPNSLFFFSSPFKVSFWNSCMLLCILFSFMLLFVHFHITFLYYDNYKALFLIQCIVMASLGDNA